MVRRVVRGRLIVPFSCVLLLAVLPSSAAAAQGAMSVYAVPSTVASNCSVDVTMALSTFIASVPDGTASAPNTVLFGSGGCYRVDYPFVVAYRNNLTIDGNDATIRR